MTTPKKLSEMPFEEFEFRMQDEDFHQKTIDKAICGLILQHKQLVKTIKILSNRLLAAEDRIIEIGKEARKQC